MVVKKESTTLMTAHNQWANRPPDERFGTLAELRTAAEAKRARSQTVGDRMGKLRFDTDKKHGVVVYGSGNRPAAMTNFAFVQLATKLQFPASGLTRLQERPDLVCDVLNHCRSRMPQDRNEDGDVEDEVQILLDRGVEGTTIRSINSPKYARIHDLEMLKYADRLASMGWRVPPARPVDGAQPGSRKATKEDVMRLGTQGIQVREGDQVAPAGLYMGDRDMFVFMTDDAHPVDDGGGSPLMRGVFFVNSEVGFRNLTVTEFLCQAVCGNHIVWGATNIVQIRYRHIGEARDRVFKALDDAITKNLASKGLRSLDKERRVFAWMRKEKLGTDKLTTVENAYSLGIPTLTKARLGDAYNYAERNRDVDGDPQTWWGMTNALTRYSQTTENADDRFDIDAGAGKMFEAAAKVALV